MELDRFNRYEENFLNCTRIISRCLNHLDSANGNVDQIISASVEIEGELSEAEGFLRAMDIEFRSMASSDKVSAQKRLNDYKQELTQTQSQYSQAKFKAESIALKGSSSGRQKLLNLNQRLDSSTATLESSRQIIAQTENIGSGIITDLGSQREQLQDAKQKVKETRDFTSQARNVLRQMGNRAIIHKLCMILLIIGLAAAIVAVGYYGMQKK